MQITDDMVDRAARVLNKRLADRKGLHGVSREMLEAALSALEPQERDGWKTKETWEFQIGDFVQKKSGSWWEGRVVGHYATWQTPNGVCVQLDKPMGPVQIYPAHALELVAPAPHREGK